MQGFLFAVWPDLLPNFLYNHLYTWAYNIRESTVLGLASAGGLWLLVAEAVAVSMGAAGDHSHCDCVLVVAFDALSRRVRSAVL